MLLPLPGMWGLRMPLRMPLRQHFALRGICPVLLVVLVVLVVLLVLQTPPEGMGDLRPGGNLQRLPRGLIRSPQGIHLLHGPFPSRPLVAPLFADCIDRSKHLQVRFHMGFTSWESHPGNHILGITSWESHGVK